MTPIRKMAEEIADDLFTNGFGNVAQRLVLTIDTPVPRDLGGWSYGAVVDRIEQKLRAVKPGSLL